jgi:hypothetical protein
MAGAALVLIEKGTHTLFGGKHPVEEGLPLAEAGQLRGAKARNGLSGSSGNQEQFSSGASFGTGGKGESQEHDVKSVHFQYVPFPVWESVEIFIREPLAPT